MAIQHAQKLGRKYQNTIPTAEGPSGGFWKTMYKFLFEKGDRKPDRVLGPFVTDISIYDTPPANGLRVTWLGHSSIIIEIDGHRLLTDPVYGRASFSQVLGPKRFF